MEKLSCHKHDVTQTQTTPVHPQSYIRTSQTKTPLHPKYKTRTSLETRTVLLKKPIHHDLDATLSLSLQEMSRLHLGIIMMNEYKSLHRFPFWLKLSSRFLPDDIVA